MEEQTVQASFNVVDSSLATIKYGESDLKYFVRYYLVDEAGNRTSYLSNINEINQGNAVSLLNGFVPTYSISSVESGGQALNIKWLLPDNFASSKLDIYFSWSWDAGGAEDSFIEYEYADTVISNSYYITIPTQSSVKAKFVKMAVQIPTQDKFVSTNALLFETVATTTLPILDGGTI